MVADLIGRGRAYEKKKDYDRAILDFEAALKLDATSAAAYVGRGDQFYYKRDFARAMADFTTAIRLDPNHADGWSFRGVVRREMGAPDEALRRP